MEKHFPFFDITFTKFFKKFLSIIETMIRNIELLIIKLARHIIENDAKRSNSTFTVTKVHAVSVLDGIIEVWNVL